MKFIDIATIFIKSGDGGPGHISFRREKGVPKGGPDGGNGGKGADVVFKADTHMNTLLDFKFKRQFIAPNGNPGEKYNRTGKNGKELLIRVPLGTVVKDAATDEVLFDLTEPGQEIVAAFGGKGGHGNGEFATPTNQAPRYAEPGLPGQEYELTLELKLIADVGIVGLPNVGKSTLISVISAAKPKIADYHFTTLVPNLGIVNMGESQSFTVADIPGLIEGASEGKGLGIQFLRHIERTRALVFLLDVNSDDQLSDYKALRNELEKYNPEINKKQAIICFSKTDTVDEDRIRELKKIKFKDKDIPVFFISAVTRENIEKVKWEMWNRLNAGGDTI